MRIETNCLCKSKYYSLACLLQELSNFFSEECHSLCLLLYYHDSNFAVCPKEKCIRRPQLCKSHQNIMVVVLLEKWESRNCYLVLDSLKYTFLLFLPQNHALKTLHVKEKLNQTWNTRSKSVFQECHTLTMLEWSIFISFTKGRRFDL